MKALLAKLFGGGFGWPARGRRPSESLRPSLEMLEQREAPSGIAMGRHIDHVLAKLGNGGGAGKVNMNDLRVHIRGINDDSI